MKARAAVILIQNDKIALIERNRRGTHYFTFPGGKVKAAETPAQAAARETLEEIGLQVNIGSMIAEIWFRGAPQYYFLAESIGGSFGNGNGAELSSLSDSEKGSYLPLWLEIDELINKPVVPHKLSRYVWKSLREGWPENPLIIPDDPHDELSL
jgi:8-oxo-dGTP pyrophosphatase MutT (NUDIX family)